MPEKVMDREGFTMLTKDADWKPIKTLLEIISDSKNVEQSIFFSFSSTDGWVVVDNTTGDAWTETFDDWWDALDYIRGVNITELGDGRVVQIGETL